VKLNTSQHVWPRINSNWWINENRAKRGFKKPARIFFATSPANFWERDISSASKSAFPGFLRYFGLLKFFQKEVFWYTRIHSLLINGVVTALSHALWRVLSNKVIWVLRHVQICRLWVRHPPCCTLFLINCFGIEMALCDLYLKRFDLTKTLLFDTFSITVWYKLCREMKIAFIIARKEIM